MIVGGTQSGRLLRPRDSLSKVYNRFGPTPDSQNSLRHHGLSRRYDGSHHLEWDLLWARSPIRERHIRWQIWHSKLLVDGGPDLRRSHLASNS